MSNVFENASIVKAANVYFDGKVSSRTLTLSNGERVTLGFMLAGKYNFGTEAAEVMEVISGSAYVTLKGETKGKTYIAGDSFNVPANFSFDIEVESYMDYCCSYKD